MLLERENANPNQADTEYDWTLLWWEAGMRYEGVVKMLLKRKDVCTAKLDNKC